MIWTIIFAAALIGLWSIPFIVALAVLSLSPIWLLGGGKSNRDLRARSLAVKNFLAGLAYGIAFRKPSRTNKYLSLTPFEKPFYVEGAYAGLLCARWLAPWRPQNDAEVFQQEHGQFMFLIALGSGFAGGLRTMWSSAISPTLEEVSQGIDDKLSQMCFDGYAFQRMIYHYRRHPGMLRDCVGLSGSALRGAYEGIGRALWFLAPDFASFQAAIAVLPDDCMTESYIGFGIATGFAGIEDVAAGVLTTYPSVIGDSSHFKLGLVVGLFARYYTALDYVEGLFAREQPGLLNAVKEAALLFDKLWEKNVGYQDWRDALRLQLEQSGFLITTISTMAGLAG